MNGWATTTVRALSGRAKLWAYVGDMSRVLRNRYPRSRGAAATGRLLPWPDPAEPSTARSARTPSTWRFLAGETARLLDGARAASQARRHVCLARRRRAPGPDTPPELWVATRMTHLFSVGHLLGRDGDGELADLGIMGLRNAFADTQNGGWFPALDDEGPTDTHKQAYGHAFVVLAAASSTIAGRPGAADLLDDALERALRPLLGGRGGGDGRRLGPPLEQTSSPIAGPTPTCTRWRHSWPRLTRRVTRCGSTTPRGSCNDSSWARPASTRGTCPSTTTSTGRSCPTTTAISLATHSVPMA